MSHTRRTDLEPFVELSHFDVDAPSVRLLGYRFCQQNDVVVLGRVDRRSREPVTLGTPRTGDAALLREVRSMLRRPVEPVRLNAWEVQQALDIGYGILDPMERGDRGLVLEPVSGFTFDRDADAPRLIDEILGRAVELEASDVHIEIYENDIDVRYRIEGVLHQISTPLSAENIAAVLSRLKVLANLDIAERRRAQDGRIQATFTVDGHTRLIDFRLSVVPGPLGEDAVLRILDGARSLLELATLGFSETVLGTFEELLTNPEGFFLVCGPTSSGKTTTLYSALAHLTDSTRKVLTVEDPIEYYFPKINQKQVTAQMGFADYTRAFMRQDPDVLLIGEVRDRETAEVALRAAQTGHLVLSTLHANDSVRAIARLDTFDVPRNLTAGSLLGTLWQRLARSLCGRCRQEVSATAEEAHRLGLDEGDGPFFRSAGCAACHGTGFKGRTGLFELFVVDGEIADLIAAGAPVHHIRARAVELGMATLLDDALVKAREGLTSLEEILRTVPYRLLQDALELRNSR